MLVADQYKRSIVKGISIFFILLFTFSAATKFQQLKTFELQLEQFPFIGGWATWLAWGLPGILILVSGLLLFESLRRLALYSSFLVMLIFTIYIVAVLNFAESVPCSCAGVFTSWSWNEQLYFNISGLLLALLGIALNNHIKEPKHKILSPKMGEIL